LEKQPNLEGTLLFCIVSMQLHVPKGWDKLFGSIVSVETGRTTTKSGKASVRNGTCQWEEGISESVWISPHDASKDNEKCLVKLVVAKV
jgi:hypothetical protein